MNKPTALLVSIALLLALPPFCFGTAQAGRDGNPPQCPLPIPTGERIDPALELQAWEAAKDLAGAPEGWKKPGATVRYNTLFGQIDPMTGERQVYGGFYYDPAPFWHEPSGRVYACEYVEVWLPPELDRFLLHVLTHEYLHAIFFRYSVSDEAFADAHRDQFENGGEAWVQDLLPNPEGW